MTSTIYVTVFAGVKLRPSKKFVTSAIENKQSACFSGADAVYVAS